LKKTRLGSYCDFGGAEMRSIHVIYHHEEGSWWAESPDLKGWTAIADTYEEIVKLVEEGIPFALECEAELAP
jgi:predicted RNase H-like HicB family nuclease